jgi:hypothetical protein
METSDWPPSNYPIFLALVLLLATAVTLAMGDQSLAEDLAIYAYYLLVTGVTIRFFELVLPSETPQKIDIYKCKIHRLLKKSIQIIYENIPDNIISIISNKPMKLVNEVITNLQIKFNLNLKTSHIVYISDILKDITIYLSTVFVLMLVYGFIFGWWNIEGYLPELAMIIIGFFLLYVITIIFIRKSCLNK